MGGQSLSHWATRDVRSCQLYSGKKLRSREGNCVQVEVEVDRARELDLGGWVQVVGKVAWHRSGSVQKVKQRRMASDWKV